MCPTPVFGQTGDEDFDWAIDIPDNHPVASEASLGYVRRKCDGFGYLCWWTPACSLNGSPTLVEDAQAVLNGDANHLLGYHEPLADVEGPSDMDLNAVAPHVMHIPVVPQVSGPKILPHGAPSQLQPRVPISPTYPASNNQVQRAAVTAPPQCPYGCTGTFRRREEYRRHMKKHTGPFFPCTYPSCNKMFYRQDKLRNHLAKGH